jgi:hypothetical protein
LAFIGFSLELDYEHFNNYDAELSICEIFFPKNRAIRANMYQSLQNGENLVSVMMSHDVPSFSKTSGLSYKGVTKKCWG